VTHDQVEAMTLGHRVAVLREGVLQQVDRPQTLFRQPANLFVAAFIGSPSMNLVEADVAETHITFASYDIPLPSGSRVPEGRVILGIRPTDFEHAAAADPAFPRLQVRPDVVEDLGSETHVIFPVDAPRVVAEAVLAAAHAPEDDSGVLFADEQRSLFTACVDARQDVVPGSSIELALDTRRLHFFDPATGGVLGASA
jgi:multiple sugar transport system ATP-binding protein